MKIRLISIDARIIFAMPLVTHDCPNDCLSPFSILDNKGGERRQSLLLRDRQDSDKTQDQTLDFMIG
jgi:hypothetical protein